MCFYNDTALGDEYNITCDRDPLNPVTREFSVTTDGGRSIALRELEVFGFGRLMLVAVKLFLSQLCIECIYI